MHSYLRGNLITSEIVKLLFLKFNIINAAVFTELVCIFMYVYISINVCI